MKVVVFGSTGRTGKQVINESLEQGHKVLAFSRDANKLDGLSHQNLKIIEGDVLNQSDVERAVKDQDVVMVTLGSGKDRKSTIRSQGTKTIIEAMKAQGVKRLICQTTLGAGDSHANLNFFWKRIMFGWFLKQVFLDHELQEKYVRNSGLNWTIVRPAAFTDGEKTTTYKEGFSPNEPALKLKISTADIAHFIVRQFSSNSYLHQTPGLSY